MGEKSEVIIDTDILIKIYRGNKEHKRVLEAISPNLIISCITKMELLVGCINEKMQQDVEENLNLYNIIPINNQIISIANNIIKKYSFSHKMSVADTLIAATAFSYSLELFTDNKKHFNFIEGIKFYNEK